MGKTGKWLRNILVGKKDKIKDKDKDKDKESIAPEENPATPVPIAPATPREKRRWSFRRSSATSSVHIKDSGSASDLITPTSSSASALNGALESESDRKKHALAVAAATAAAADAAVAAAQAAAAVIKLTAGAGPRSASPLEEAAAVRIQSVYRSYLARKALRALRGLVKLQALVRGHLVRRQATATLRCMQALVTAQARARIQRLRMSEDSRSANPRPSTSHRRSIREDRSRIAINHEMDNGAEENIKIVEMDIGEMKTPPPKTRPGSAYTRQDANQLSPAPSALAEMSPRTCSGHFEDYNSLCTAQSSPKCYSAVAKVTPFSPFASRPDNYPESVISYHDYPLYYPNYMANTESSRAKARSQSAPKQRPVTFERQPSVRRRASLEGRNVPRAVRMQRSSSQVGSAARDYQYPWSVKLDRSSMSIKDSECGSTSTVLTNTNYCRSVVSYETHGSRYQKGLPPPHQAV